MSTIKYTEEHEWIKIEGDTITIGITDFAQEQLGNIVYVDLPNTGDTFSAGDDIVIIESVKAAGEIHAPTGGTVIETNDELTDNPELANEDPTGKGWFFRATISDSFDDSTFMNEDQYKDFIQQ